MYVNKPRRGSHRLFLRWSLFATVMAIATGVLFFAGYFHKLNDLDMSKLSFLIVALCWAMTFYCGLIAWRIDNILDRGTTNRLKRVENQTEHVWFSVAKCQEIGLLGTVVGFLMAMLGGFQHLNSTDPESLRVLLASLASGVSTALLTTLVGLVCSIILGLQHHVLTNVIESNVDESS